jgi:hypothetical protein
MPRFCSTAPRAKWREFQGHREPRCQSRCVARKPAAPELIDRQRCRFIERAGRDLNAVPDALAIGEGNDAGARGGHVEYCSAKANKRRIRLNTCLSCRIAKLNPLLGAGGESCRFVGRNPLSHPAQTLTKERIVIDAGDNYCGIEVAQDNGCDGGRSDVCW